MTRHELREFRTFCAGYPNESVLDWLDAEIDYFDAAYEAIEMAKEIDLMVLGDETND